MCCAVWGSTLCFFFGFLHVRRYHTGVLSAASCFCQNLFMAILTESTCPVMKPTNKEEISLEVFEINF